MREETRAVLLSSLFVLFFLVSAGCSDEMLPAETPVPSPSATGPRYNPGDIIATPASAASSSLYVILGYDAGTDQYTRALVEKNADGSWGHRPSGRTETVNRSVIDRVYTVKISHVSVSSIPVITPAAAGTPPATAGSGEPPEITKITPSYASRGSAVSFFVTGRNFEQGATVKLLSGGSMPLAAGGLTVTFTGITGVFDLTGKPDGSYDVIVTNPGGQSDDLRAGFTVGEPLPVITSLNPVTAEMGRNVPISVYGQNFRNNIRVTFANNTTELTCTNPITTESEKISCNLRLDQYAGARPGEWTVTVLNVDTQKKSTWARKFLVTNTSTS